MSAQIQAARAVRRGVVVIVAALSLAACGPAASNSSHHSGSGPSRSAGLASRILPVSALQPQLAHGPTVLIFMATGCVSCAADVGQLRQALASYPGVQAVGIDIVPQDTSAELASFLDNQDLTNAPLLWTIDTDGSLVARYQMAMLDATVGIDRHGVIAFRNAVPADAATLASQLAALVKA
jgi:hypothetical protein